MLSDLLEKGYGTEKGYNCVQKILFGANQMYDLGIEEDLFIPFTTGLGGGMKSGNNCGAIIGAVMVLSKLFPEKEQQQEVIQELISKYEAKMGSLNCTPLKERYRTEEKGCTVVICAAAEILEEMIEKYKK